jgi:photosystem II stability/assembly factor-like uncharacterized protein
MNDLTQVGTFGGPVMSLDREPGGRLLLVTPEGLFRDSAPYENLLDGHHPGITPVPTSVRVALDETIWIGVVGGVLASRDRGTTWTPHPFRMPAPTVSSLIALDAGRILLAGTMEDGVMRSEDGGNTWTAWNFGLFDRSALFLATTGGSAGLVAVASETGCFVSSNIGKSWTDTEFAAGAPVTALSGFDDGFLIGDATGHLYYWSKFQSWRAVSERALDAAIAGIQPLPYGQAIVIDERGAVIRCDPDLRTLARCSLKLPPDDVVVSAVAWHDGHHIDIAAGCAGGAVRRARLGVA